MIISIIIFGVLLILFSYVVWEIRQCKKAVNKLQSEYYAFIEYLIEIHAKDNQCIKELDCIVKETGCIATKLIQELINTYEINNN